MIVCQWYLEHNFPVWLSISRGKYMQQTQSWQTYEHFLILGNCDTLALNHMDIFQPTQHIMVHLKDNLGEEFGALLDCEWFILECFQSVGTSQVESDVGLSGSLNGERLDDAFPGVVGVADGLTGVQT
jgi:hypothetical protein